MRVITICISLLLLFPAAIKAQSTASLNVSTFKIEAPQLDTLKTIWIYLPENYKTSSAHYPVIYMHDAQNLFDKESSYVGEWKVDEYLDSISESQTIIVGVEHGEDKRIDELTPFENKKYGGGKGTAYIDFIKFTLKPHIDATYRTKNNPENTTIFGSSLGGLISLYAAVKYPETFGNAGVFSPSLWFSDEIFKFIEASDLKSNSRFYVLGGTKEGETLIPNLRKLDSLFQKKGLKARQYQIKTVEGGEHNESFWSRQFPEAYNWLILKNTEGE